MKKSRKQEAQEGGGEEEEESSVAARQEAGLLTQLLTAVTSGNSKQLADLVAGLGQEGSVAGLGQEGSVAGLGQEGSVAGLDQGQEASQAQEGAILAGAGQKEASVASLVNSQFGESRSSCLHIAAREGHRAVIARSSLSYTHPSSFPSCISFAIAPLLLLPRPCSPTPVNE